MSDRESLCGYVALVGRPNVGKSTLLNHLIGQKLSITSRKPQTTRHQVLGIKTSRNVQLIFVDTPGLHVGAAKAINRYMNRAARAAIRDVDVVVMVVEGLRWTEADQGIADEVQATGKPLILAINKIDLLRDKSRLLPYLERVASLAKFKAMVPVSALRKQFLDRLESEIASLCPKAPALFPEDQTTDRTERFLVGEVVREKLVRQLGDELPYASAILVERFDQIGTIRCEIDVSILVENSSQKAIVIGRGGKRIKQIGAAARKDIQRLLGQPVNLGLWVRVKRGWSDDQRALQALGYQDT